jgi:aspartokinase/homoserine dehydrogenase 1
MKVLKFGGSSVANAENIEKVISIISESASESPCIVVLSAMQGTTDELIAAARAAESGSEGFRVMIDAIGKKHFDAMGLLLPGGGREGLNTFVREGLEELQRTCEGIFLLRELSRKTLDRILSFGELLSTRIVSETLTARGIENKWKDSRELIRTDSNFGSAAVDFKETNKAVGVYF